MQRWVGRTAIVTGASAGIGAGIARMLAEKGMNVIGVARRPDRVKALAEELKGCNGKLIAMQGDVTKEDDVIRFVKWTNDNLGGADVLVNNAGVAPLFRLTGGDTASVRKVVDTNIVGLTTCTREFLKDLRSRKVDDGHIFNINSVCGQSVVNFPGLYAYIGTKHAVTAMTEGLRRELIEEGSKIRVTSLSPGLVTSDIFEASGSSSEEHNKIFNENISLRVEDIADALVYVLGTPPHVQIHELTIKPVGEKF